MEQQRTPNAVKMIRCFMPIGHGGFCVERFSSGPVIVYDCGCMAPSRMKLDNAICSEFDIGDRVEKLFISHFHQDHINGIKTLLEHCDVKEIYVPLLTPIDQLLHYFVARFKGRKPGFAEDFILRPISAIREISPSTHIVAVASPSQSTIAPYASDFSNSFFNEAVGNALGLEPLRSELGSNPSTTEANMAPREKIEVISSGRALSISESAPFWQFVPYCFQYDERRERLLAELKARDIGPNDIMRALKTQDRKELKIIKSAFSKATGRSAFECNFHTMTVYSGPVEPTGWLQKARSCSQLMGRLNAGYCDIESLALPAGCIYFGDYETVNEKGGWGGFETAYKAVWPNAIGCIQVPHHGSKNNYRCELTKASAFFAFQADGRRLPHPSVLEDLIGRQLPILIASEKPESRIELTIYQVFDDF